MTSHDAFVCPSCGGPLTVHGDEAEVQCPFCGTTVVVPEELRSKPTPPPPPAAPVAAPRPEVIVVEERPSVVYEQAPERMPQPARRSGCGCGCLSRLVAVLVLIAVLAGALYIGQPALFARIVAQVQAIAASFSSSPQIIAFTVSPTTTTSGGTVFAVWVTNADNVRLERMAQQGTQTLSSLPAAGERTFTITSETGEIVFRLTALKNGQQETREARVTVRRR